MPKLREQHEERDAVGIRRAIASTYMFCARWSMDARAPLPDRCLIIGAPHTSNWDGFFMLMAMWKLERRFHFLIKDSTMKVPLLGAFLKACGGISVNRADPGDLVARFIDMAETSDSLTLVIAPKGTRSPRPLWKSGFYRIATQANLPVVPGFIDSVTRSYGWGEAMELSGDVRGDMDRIREFYAPMLGHNPQKTSVPRLRAEEDEPSVSAD